MRIKDMVSLITTDLNSAMNQSELEANICNKRKRGKQRVRSSHN